MRKQSSRSRSRGGRSNLYKAEFIVALSLLAIVMVSVYRPSMTGYVPSNVLTQQLDLVVDSSQSYRLTTSDRFISFALSGSVAGNGAVYVWLDNKAGAADSKILLWTNVRPASPLTGAKYITGLAIDIGPGQEIPNLGPQNAETWSGIFVNECMDTCLISPAWQTGSYDLVFQLEEGTTLNVDGISYILP